MVKQTRVNLNFMRKKKIEEVPVSKKTSRLILNYFEQEDKNRPYLKLTNDSIGANSIIRILEREEDKVFVNLDNEYFLVDLKNKVVKGYGSLFDTNINSSEALALMH